MESMTNTKCFPGYSYHKAGELDNAAHNMYKGIDVGFGGYIYGDFGIYTNVALLDVSSLHPHSIIAMNCFGEYTKRYKELLDARIYIKHHDYESAGKLLDGALIPYLTDERQADDLAKAIKLSLNSVYGLTSASFDNPFRDKRNVNNIVALRGALFMIDLQEEVDRLGYKVVSIRTDSIKIANADKKIIDFCMEFAKGYGYSFEHEATYERMCLITKADYIAKYSNNTDINGKHAGKWTATAKTFQDPYVFKTLFSREEITLSDMTEIKSTKSALYLDFNENLTNGEHKYHFVGKIGQFCPVKEGCGGGLLLRLSGYDDNGNPKFAAAEGTKGYRWKETKIIETLGLEDQININYYREKIDDVYEIISQYGDVEKFRSDEPYIIEDEVDLPWDPDGPGVDPLKGKMNPPVYN